MSKHLCKHNDISKYISRTVVFLCNILIFSFKKNLLEMFMFITIINIFGTKITFIMYFIHKNNTLDKSVY